MEWWDNQLIHQGEDECNAGLPKFGTPREDEALYVREAF